MTEKTLLEAAQSLAARVRDAYPKPFFAMKYEVHAELIHALEQAIEREKAKPKGITEVINDLTPTRIRCANCKFEHYDKLEAPCLPCRFYSNWEPKP